MNTVSFDFTGAHVLVTGGTSGIGNAIAAGFAGAGATVTVTGTRGSAADYPETDLSAYTYRQCQIQDPGSVDALADSLGELDILVNNAGGPYPAGDEYDPDGYVASVTQNMFGPMRLTMRCHDLLRSSQAPGGASVVSVVSMSAFRSAVFVPGYASSKMGLIALTMNLSRRWADDGIRVNAIAPGLTDTAQPRYGNTEEQIAVRAREIPLGRIAKPEEIARIAVFLASEDSGWITGELIHVNGGAYMA